MVVARGAARNEKSFSRSAEQVRHCLKRKDDPVAEHATTARTASMTNPAVAIVWAMRRPTKSERRHNAGTSGGKRQKENPTVVTAMERYGSIP
jgi:hypothetical protein